LLKGAFTTAEAGAGVLGTSLSVTGAAVTGVGLAAVAGVAYWQLYMVRKRPLALHEHGSGVQMSVNRLILH